MFGKFLKVSFMAIVVSLLLAGAAWSSYEWKVANIGGADSEQGPYQGGDVEFLDNGFIITATGGDIYSNKLGCTLAYIEGGLSGDFTIEYTIVEHTGEPPTTWTKCGVMIAEAIDPETPYFFMASTPSNEATALNDKGCKIVTRPEWAGAAGPGSNGLAPLSWPVTYKVVRTGDLFTAWVSFDGGQTYQTVADPADGKAGEATVVLPDPVVVGIALAGHNAGLTTGTARIADIKINGELTSVEPVAKMTTTWAELKVE